MVCVNSELPMLQAAHRQEQDMSFAYVFHNYDLHTFIFQIHFMIRKGAIAPGCPDPLLSGTFTGLKIRAVAQPVRRQVN